MKLLTPINDLKSADESIISLFKPYIRGNKRKMLPFAISLCQQGSLEGERQISNSANIPFVASWSMGNSLLPSDLTRCLVQFDSNPDFSYKLLIANHQLVDYLIEVIINYQQNRIVDFSKAFYYKLLQREL